MADENNEISLPRDSVLSHESQISQNSLISQETNSSEASEASLPKAKRNEFRELKYEIITGWTRNSKILCAENFFYSYNTRSGGGVSWLCSHTTNKKRDCSARVILTQKKCIQKTTSKHTHPNCAEERKQLHVLNEAKRRCASLETFLASSRVSTRTIYNQVLLE